MNDFAGSADQIAKQLVAGGMEPDRAMMMALRMAQSRQQADQSILGGVPAQPPVSDVPPATEILGGDPSKLFQRQPTTMERVRDLPKDVLGAGEALVSLGSLAALAPASMMYALRPGQKTQGDPMEFALRNMYMPRSERGPSHLAGLGEVLESLPQTGPLPELQAFTGVGRGVGRQLAEKGRQAGRAMAPAAANVAEDILRRQGLLMDVTAYHGSPHKFAPTEKNPLGEFNPEKIGTGEGAQAYGHGHYLAEARGVGQDYADVLASPRNRVMDKRGVYIEPSPMGGGKYMLAVGSEVGQPKGVAGDATQLIYTDKEFPNLASAIKFARQKGLLSRDQRQKLTAIGEDRKYVPVTKAADVPEPEYTQFIASDPGYLYTVDVPDKMVDKMLDWDKPLSEQSSAIKKAINDIVQAEELYKGKYAARFLDKTATGGDILGVLNEALGSPKAASSYLKDAGIPGVRYLDQGSRGSGKGTRNFVVFPGEEKDLKILERKKDGGTVNHKAVASARRALEKAMAKGGIAKAVGKAAAKAAVKTEQRGLDLERLKTTGIEVPEAGFSKEDKAVLRPLYNQGLIRVEERDGKKILVPGKGAWYEFATPEQRTRLDALQESQGVKDLSLMGPTESLLNSAQASFYDFEIVPGVRNVPIQSLEPLLPGYESAQEMKRIQNLANQIKESKQIEPLFIGVDPTGIPYIMEGQHRIRALKSLGYEDVPARIVVDMDDVEKAAGGSVKMAGGGSVIGKAAAAAAKQAKAVLSPAESQANLQKMLAESQIKSRLYHGTKAHDDYADQPGQAFEQFTGRPTWLAQEPYTASGYSGGTGSIYPVFAQVKNPLNLGFDANDDANKAFETAKRLGVDVDHIRRMEKPEKAWQVINHPAFIDAVEKAGYDGLVINEGGYKTFGVLDPRKIKSAIGNRGTYDITSPELSKAHGGEVKMGTGGSMLGTVAGRAAAAGKKSTQWAQEAAAAKRAPAKSKEEIEAIARRMAAQAQPGFVRASEEQSINPAGKSQLLYEMEQRTPMVVESTIADRPVPNVDYEQQLGKVIVGVPGDPTMGQVAIPGSLDAPTRGGKQLVQVGDVRPETPVQLYGGPRYGANLDETFWASNLSPARAVQNLVQEMAQKYGAEQVLGKYIKMSPESSRFAMHNLDALISVLQPEKLDKDKVELLNNLVRKGNPKNKFPEFAGFEDPINVLLQAQMNSKLRKQISEVLEKPSVAKQVGFPFPGKVVQTAITEPELRNVETGVTGFAIGKMNPEGKLSFSSHPTYDYDIPGQAIGRSKYLIPSEMSFPDFTAWYRSRPDVQAKVDPINMMKSYGPRQVIDQQYIDEIKMYEEAMKRLTGKKKGGLMKKSSKLPKVIKSGKVGGLSALRK